MLPTNDFDILVSVSNQLKNSYMRGYDDPWVSSPFAWIKTRLLLLGASKEALPSPEVETQRLIWFSMVKESK